MSVHGGGGDCSIGVPGPRGVCPGGVPGPGGACSRGVPGPKGSALGGGCLVPGGGGIPACTEAEPPPGETATAADGMHPTGMHSCYFLLLVKVNDVFIAFKIHDQVKM